MSSTIQVFLSPNIPIQVSLLQNLPFKIRVKEYPTTIVIPPPPDDIFAVNLHATSILYVGSNTSTSNVVITETTFKIGNSTVNTFINSSSISVIRANVSGNLSVSGITTLGGNIVFGTSGLSANGSFGNPGQVLHSNGSSTYWGPDDDASAYANGVIYTDNKTAQTYSNAVTYTDAKAANAYGNSISYTDIKAANAYSNGVTYTDNKTAQTYTNATTYSSNADNITSGTLNTARLPATANISTGINVGSNVNVNTSTIQIGNSTVNTSISAATIVINGVNVNTAITSNAAAAYSNATAYADARAANAYSNSVSYTDARAANAYSNATTFSSNADNITSGTLNTARLPATVNVASAFNLGANINVNTSVIFVGNSTVNTSISAATITINGVNVNTSITSNASAAYTNAIAIAANATNLSSGTVAFARLPALYLGTTQIQSTSVAQAVTGVTTLAAGNTTITGFANVSTTLQVSGISTLSANVAVQNYILANNSSANNEMLVGSDSGGFYFGTGFSRAPNTIPILIGGSTGNIRFRSNGQERVIIAANGNVGIGTSTPSYILDVGDLTARIADLIIQKDLTSTIGYGASGITGAFNNRLYLSGHGIHQFGMWLRGGNATTTGLDATAANGALQLYSGSAERVRVDINGNIGIANTAPASKLVIQDTLTANASSTFEINPTWNATANTFTALKVNVTDTASNASSSLMDLQVGGSSLIKITKSGTIFLTRSGEAITVNSGDIYSASGIRTGSGGVLTFNGDVTLTRDAADVLAQRRSTNAQTFNLYNTFTDASNYERGRISWLSNELVVGTEAAGTGSNRELVLRVPGVQMKFQTGGSSTQGWSITSGSLLALVDNTYSIGGSSANRPRDIFAARNIWADGNIIGGGNAARVGTNGVVAANSVTINFSSTTAADGAVDVSLARDAADTLAQRRSTNAQTFRIYETFTDSSNYSRLFARVAGNIGEIGTEAAGTGTLRPLYFSVGGATAWFMSTSRHLLAGLDNTYDIGANGANRPRNLWVGTSITASAGTINVDGANGFTFISRGYLLAPSDGVFRFTNNAQTDFNRLQFGGTTSSFPAIKRSSTAIAFRLADDTNYTDVDLWSLTAYGAINWGGDTIIYRDAANILAQRVATNAQTYRIYGTFTDASNHERLSLSANSTAAYIQAQEAGTGTARDLYIGANNTTHMVVAANGNIGIANTAPDAKLVVTGTANVSGNVRIGGITTLAANVVLGTSALSSNGTVGTAGDVLLSNGSATYWGQNNIDGGTPFSVF